MAESQTGGVSRFDDEEWHVLSQALGIVDPAELIAHVDAQFAADSVTVDQPRLSRFGMSGYIEVNRLDQAEPAPETEAAPTDPAGSQPSLSEFGSSGYVHKKPPRS